MNCPCELCEQKRERGIVALESIAESLRQLPSKRELLAILSMICRSAWTEKNSVDSELGVEMADELIAACKESEPTKGDAK